MTKFESQERTKKFHIGIIRLCASFPKNAAGFETAKQLIRSAGSVGANYRAACRGKSKNDFIYKIEIVVEEADESLYWLEIVKEADLSQSEELASLTKEANELVSIFNAADKTAKRNRSTTEPNKSMNRESYDIEPEEITNKAVKEYKRILPAGNPEIKKSKNQKLL